MKDKKRLKRFFGTLLTNSFFVLTVIFFSPMEVYLGNLIEFDFGVTQTWWILLATSLLIIAVATVFEFFVFPKKMLRAVNLLVFSFGVCFYIQSMFLNGKMISLTGDKANYSSKTILINALIWAFIIALVFIIYYVFGKKIKKRIVFNTVLFLCGALIAMQTVGIISTAFGTDFSSTSDKYNYFSEKDEFTLSSGKNVVCFIIDTCDGAYVSSALNQYPDLFSDFNGFTYYPNTTPVHSRTYPAVPYLLTGQICKFDKPYQEYIDEAYKNSTFLTDMKKMNTDIRLFTERSFISPSQYSKIDNYPFSDKNFIETINYFGFLKETLKISLYKNAPYLIKERFNYSLSEINDISIKKPTDFAKEEDDLYFYNSLKKKGISKTDKYDKAFRFYHLFGTHPGAQIDENANPCSDASYEQVLKGDLKIIAEYIKGLKECGAFDDTTIIITADHGNSGGSQNLEIPMPATCLMLVKPEKSADEAAITDNSPVSHTDFAATVIDGLGGDYSKYGKRIYDYKDEPDRERFYYYTALVSDIDGEIALREYSIKDDAKLLQNWKLTGNNWDINYSTRTVSKQRLKIKEK